MRYAVNKLGPKSFEIIEFDENMKTKVHSSYDSFNRMMMMVWPGLCRSEDRRRAKMIRIPDVFNMQFQLQIQVPVQVPITKTEFNVSDLFKKPK